MQNCPRQLAMQSCVLCSFVRCGSWSSNQIEKKEKKRKKKKEERTRERTRNYGILHNSRKEGIVRLPERKYGRYAEWSTERECDLGRDKGGIHKKEKGRKKEDFA